MSFRRILVTTDFSAPARAALVVAQDLATRYDAHLTALHVEPRRSVFPESLRPRRASGQAPSETLRSRLADEAALCGAAPDTCVVIAAPSPADAIVEYAETDGTDLVVIASLGQSSIARLLVGSVTERVVRHARCAVLTVRS